mmetsp:Transcript_13842/g.49662  ORF Transcript_13842/g.49662 Transcript_13842/m.49662 type:complete len:491 (-) Transcript_13842:2-1474(-)
MPSFFEQIICRELADGAMERLTHLAEFHSVIRGDVDVLELLVRHRLQGVVRPLPEPIDRAAVHERRELPQALAERLADRGEAQNHVQVRAALFDEVLPQLRRRLEGVPLLLGRDAALLHDRRALVVREQVRDLAAVQKVVDVLDVGFFLDLRVREQEHARLPASAGFAAKFLQILLPLDSRVTLRDGNLEALHAHDERREPREGLASGPADADAQHVRAGLFQNAANPRHVLRGVQEHREIHRRFRNSVVIDEVLFQAVHNLRHVGDLVVQTIATLRVRLVVAHVIAEHAVPELLRVDVAAVIEIEVVEQLVEILVKVRNRELFDVPEDPRPVVVVDEAVVEHAHRLVHPQAVVLADASEPGLEAFRFLQRETFDHARDVAEVKRVVRLGRRRKQLGDGGRVHLQRRVDDLLLERANLLGEVVHPVEPPEDRPEDVLERFRVKLHDRQHVEVTLVPLRDRRSAAAGGSHRRDEEHVLHVSERVLSVDRGV